jgi:hypothetical protein
MIKAVLGKALREGLHDNDSYKHFKKDMENYIGVLPPKSSNQKMNDYNKVRL